MNFLLLNVPTKIDILTDYKFAKQLNIPVLISGVYVICLCRNETSRYRNVIVKGFLS